MNISSFNLNLSTIFSVAQVAINHITQIFISFFSSITNFFQKPSKPIVATHLYQATQQVQATAKKS